MEHFDLQFLNQPHIQLEIALTIGYRNHKEKQNVKPLISRTEKKILVGTKYLKLTDLFSQSYLQGKSHFCRIGRGSAKLAGP